MKDSESLNYRNDIFLEKASRELFSSESLSKFLLVKVSFFN